MTTRPLAVPVLGLLFLLGGGAVPAPAQQLDGAWLRLDVSLHGSRITPDLAVTALDRSFAVYASFVALGPVGGGVPGQRYEVQLMVRRDGRWQPGDALTMTFLGDDERHLPGTFLQLEHDDLQFSGVLSAGCVTKTSKSGVLKKVRLKSVGGIVLKGTEGGSTQVDGGFTVRGRLVPTSKLPFAP